MARRHQLQFELKSADGKVIERVANFKLLGVTFSEDLKWNKHVEKATASAYGALKTLTRLRRFLPFNMRKQLAEALVLSRLDYGNAFLYNGPLYLHKQLQRVQNAAASFVRGRYSTEVDVIGLKWLPVLERSEFSMAKLSWKSINCRDWPKYLPIGKVIARRPTRGGNVHEGTLIACPHNIRDTFEFNASKVFNELPKICRDSNKYGSFCRDTRKYLFDRAFARSCQNVA